MKYDLKELFTFVRVANLKSFTGASKSLNISKAVVTTRINDLEKSVGMSLLARTTREVNLTSDGREFLDHCIEILKKIDDMDDFLDNHKGISGDLKIVLPPYFSRNHIVPYLQEFLQLYPKLKLRITLTENPINIIDEGLDLQIRIQVSKDENLQIAKLMSNRKVVCASPEYIKKHGSPEKPEDLRDHNCIIFGENSVWKFKDIKTNKIIELKNLSGNINCSNGEIIKELLLEGSGITLKSACDIQKEVKEKKLVILLENYEPINETEFYATYPASRNKSPKIKAFIDFFQEKLLEKQI